MDAEKPEPALSGLPRVGKVCLACINRHGPITGRDLGWRLPSRRLTSIDRHQCRPGKRADGRMLQILIPWRSGDLLQFTPCRVGSFSGLDAMELATCLENPSPYVPAPAGQTKAQFAAKRSARHWQKLIGRRMARKSKECRDPGRIKRGTPVHRS